MPRPRDLADLVTQIPEAVVITPSNLFRQKSPSIIYLQKIVLRAWKTFGANISEGLVSRHK